jgi:Big-like domain-containing protein
MSARKSLVGCLAAVVAGSALVMTAGPASAVYRPDPDDTTFTPVAADLIGVGSDTTQHALKLVADAWNADPSHTFKIATFAATENGAAAAGDATINLPSGSTARPNGSGSGKARLFGAGNVADVDFARSSDALKTGGEIEAGLKAFPFALDTVVIAASNATATNAPASLTAAQLVDIYECKPSADTWAEVGGTSGSTIKPQAPQSGSGTAKFFKAQLDAAKGSAVTYGGCVNQTVQEHDDSTVKNDADAIVPISKGRAELKGGTVKILGGFAAKRALYNVVRGDRVTDPSVQAVFGENGFICSAAANALIKSAGFEQLATPAHSGACGSPVESTSNFTLNATVATATAVTATSPAAKSVKVVAKVTGSTAPTGAVSFYEGATLVKAAVPLVSGQATLDKADVAPGAHTYRAVFTPNDSIFLGSEGSGAVTVSDVVAKAAPAISEAFPAKVKLAKKAKKATVKGTVTVKGATGKVTILKGKKSIASGTLKAGKAKVSLKNLTPGTYKLTISYAGDATHLAGTKKFTVKVVKAKK